MEPHNEQRSVLSLVEILHEATILLEVLPPAALKNLSATCRSLRTLYCARVTVITLSDPADAAKLSCPTWPHLMMVVTTSGSNLNSKLSAQWEYMMEMQVWPSFDHSTKIATLIRSPQQLHTPLIDLPSQHGVALLGFADKHRDTAQRVRLQGPFIGCRVLQSLTHDVWPQLAVLEMCDAPQLGLETVSLLTNLSLTHIAFAGCCLDTAVLQELSTGWPQLRSIQLRNNQLDANTISAIRQAKWPELYSLHLDVNILGVAGMQHIVSCSFPLMQYLTLKHACLDAPALQCLAQGQWPLLTGLKLNGNNIDATGVSCLVKGNWPSLCRLTLSDQGLDEGACLLLGIAEVDRSRVLAAQQLESRSVADHICLNFQTWMFGYVSIE